MKRRNFLQMLAAGLTLLPACRLKDDTTSPDPNPEPPLPPPVDKASKIFWVKGIPDQPFGFEHPNNHMGVDALLDLMAFNELSFYKRKNSFSQPEAYGLIAADDVVLIKVNAQWKYRGCIFNPERGVRIGSVTRDESGMQVFATQLS
jgi:hypothetical protein